MLNAVVLNTLHRVPCFSIASGQKLLGHSSQRLIKCRRHLSRSAVRAHLKEYNPLGETPVRPTATWLTTRGADLDLDKVLSQLPRIDVAENPEQARYLTTALFLTTPRLAYLFEPGHNFLADAISRIFPTIRRDVQRRSIVAVVDTLPAVEERDEAWAVDYDGYEGIAVCVSTHFKVTHAANKSENLPLLTLRARPHKDHSDLFMERDMVTFYRAPVANTLFVNGRLSTMFEQIWRSTRHRTYAEASKRQYLAEVEIPVYSRAQQNARARSFTPAVLSTELIRLTKPATIVSSMGNIIRQVKRYDGKILAASHELEHIIPPLVQAKRQENPSIELRVFALVFRRMRVSKHGYKETVFKFSEETGWRLSARELNNSFMDGARLHRVTSGGAGWGQKAGLLSLEPSTGLHAGRDESHDTDTSFDINADSIRMHGAADLFPPGHIVQFVAAWHQPDGKERDLPAFADQSQYTKWLNGDYFDETKNQWFFAGTASVSEHAEDSPDRTEIEQKASQIFWPNKFGFLSVSPISFSVEAVDGDGSQHVVHSTLIEVPNTSFAARWLAEGDKENVTQSAVSKRNEYYPSVFDVTELLSVNERSKSRRVALFLNQVPYKDRRKAFRETQRQEAKRRVRSRLEQTQRPSMFPRIKKTPSSAPIKIRPTYPKFRIRLNSHRPDAAEVYRKSDVDSTTRHPPNEPGRLLRQEKLSNPQREELTSDSNATTDKTGSSQSREMTKRARKLRRQRHRILIIKYNSKTETATSTPQRKSSGSRVKTHPYSRPMPQRKLSRLRLRTHPFGRFFRTHAYGRPFNKIVKSYLGRARRIPFDDPRMVARTAGPRRHRRLKIRAVSRDPPLPEFKSMFYQSRITNEENEAIDSLLGDLEASYGGENPQGQSSVELAPGSVRDTASTTQELLTPVERTSFDAEENLEQDLRQASSHDTEHSLVPFASESNKEVDPLPAPVQDLPDSGELSSIGSEEIEEQDLDEQITRGVEDPPKPAANDAKKNNSGVGATSAEDFFKQFEQSSDQKIPSRLPKKARNSRGR
ncbi:hypothetical protein OHC33_001628 [Knufia fluminis]|uniref:Uncharacterized protein n=1 Tax=Knufia fluminis TaxID=191047 RepID=A0AAN8EZK0_9EURO|nr:hypothetical protein OHC33_001628 [Knufia fluminis]